MSSKERSFIKKAWHFVMYEDSWSSWTVSIILAFLLIKFIVYPGLGLLLGAKYPIVAVVSGSMEHDGSFDTWWASPANCNNAVCTQEDFYQNVGITQQTFQTFDFQNGFNKGDIMILYSPKKIEVGDVIVFQARQPEPIIHRAITINSQTVQTKGDHNLDQIIPPNKGQIDERAINKENIIGKAVIRVPYLGYLKIWAVDLYKIVKNTLS
ncbi:signal peptidase I [Candidatus Woesearchaeota archaeon]|nr:signal peptidase I [Candidatus Woesearchaeota archaeon]